MRNASFLTLALKRALNRWQLTVLSLIGVSLTIGLIASIPVFTDSVGFRILERELERYAYGNQNPPLAMRYYRIPSSPQAMTVQEALDLGDWLGLLTAHEIGLPIARSHTQIGSDALMMRTLTGDDRYGQRDLRLVRINCVPNVERHIEIIEGPPLLQADASDELLLWARPELLAELGVQPGEEFELFSYNAVHPDQPLRFRVAGTWRATDPEGSFWYRDPHELLGEEFLTSVGAFARLVAPFTPRRVDFSFWYHVVDDGSLRFDHVDRYARGVRIAQYKAEAVLPSMRVDRSPIEPLREVQGRTRVLKQLLFGFSLPVIALLLYFVGSISSIAVRYQQNEVALLMSRGASRVQVLAISALEGGIHIAMGTPLGLLASLGIARAMSLNSGFLTFDRGDPLQLATQAMDWRIVVAAMAISLTARLIPAMRAASRTIVGYERERARFRRANTALGVLIAIILVATSAYAYNQLRVRGTLGLVSWEPNEGAPTDPLLFLAPTLFVFTVAWIASKLFPLFMRIPELVGSLLPSTSLYLGLKDVSREGSHYVVPLLLLVMCLCLGAFQASIARGANAWLVDHLRYEVGADYTFALGTMQGEGGEVLGKDAWLLPVESYLSLPGVEDATRVGVYIAEPKIETIPRARLLGVDRIDFSRVAYFRRDYAEATLGELMNHLATAPNGILVTRSVLRESSLNLGDKLTLDVYVDVNVQLMEFVIVGTFDYFPTMYDHEEPVMVANLAFVHAQCGGIYPHSIWLRTAPDIDSHELMDGIKNMRVVPVQELDSRALIAEDQQRLERVGIFGNLSVGFLAASLLACLGMLVYTFASLAGRVHGFTIMRAIGLGLSQLLATVSVEYLAVIIYGILMGTATGITAARLYGPYFQFTDDPRIQVPPFVPQIAWNQILWIAVAYFAILALAELIVLLRTTRREVFQALRLGDEE